MVNQRAKCEVINENHPAIADISSQSSHGIKPAMHKIESHTPDQSAIHNCWNATLMHTSEYCISLLAQMAFL